MSSKEALVRDIAKLFSKYSLEDWQHILHLLRSGAPNYAEFETAIREIKSRTTHSKKTKKGGTLTLDSDVDPVRADLLNKVYSDLRSSPNSPTLSELRYLYLNAGGKDKLPSKRDSALQELLRYISKLPDEPFALIARQVVSTQRDLQVEYSKWFDMITKLGHPPAE